jgi:hypothetical protein
MTLSTSAWGTDWQWFWFADEGSVGADGSRAVDTSVTIPGTTVALRLRHRASADPTDSNAILLDYLLSAQEAAKITQVVLALRPEQACSQVVMTRPSGELEPWTLEDSDARILGDAKAIRFQCSTASIVDLAFDRPHRITNEGRELRVELVGQDVAPDRPMSLQLRLTANDAMRFYPRRTDAAVKPQRSGWFSFPVGQYGTPVDLSFLNKDADGQFVPAGTHGFLEVDGDHFVFEDGSEARFWGVNVTSAAALSSASRARDLADRLAKLGVNVVRLHHLDSWYEPIVDYGHPSGTSQHLNAESMRRLDRLIHELRQRGIYIVLDPWVQRTFTAADEVPGYDQLGTGSFHLHPYIFFDPRMRQLHKEFLRAFWSHRNEFTGLAYKDDPAIIFTALANEALMQRGANHVQLEPYRSDFIRRYRDWALRRLIVPWPEDRVITANGSENHQRFYMDVMSDFYSDMRAFLRQEVGLRIPMNATNWFRWHWEIASQQGLDLMDAHLYYGGDDVGPGGGLDDSWVAHAPDALGTPFGRIAAMRIDGKPLVATEVAHNPPKFYRAAYYPGLAAVASLQGWSALMVYAYSQSPQPDTHLSGEFFGAYEMEADPVTIASFAAATLIYRRGDVAAARETVVVRVDDDDMFEFHYGETLGEAYENTGWFNSLIETHRVAVLFGDGNTTNNARFVTPAEMRSASLNGDEELRSDTGELWRNWRVGVGTIDTPRTQAAYGSLGSQEAIATSGVRFAIDNSFASVSISALTSVPIRESAQLLLTAVARGENTGTTYDFPGRRIIDQGEAPVLVEPVVGVLTIDTQRDGYRVYAIAADGSRGEPVTLLTKDGVVTFDLRSEYRTLFYLFEAM